MKRLSVAGVGTGLGIVLVAGCAPDAWNNAQATGFNGFLDRAATECAPLQVGPVVLTRNFSPPNYAADQYDQWLDQTSRLYYRKISPQTYLDNVNNFFGDARTQASARCVVSKLPPP